MKKKSVSIENLVPHLNSEENLNVSFIEVHDIDKSEETIN